MTDVAIRARSNSPGRDSASESGDAGRSGPRGRGSPSGDDRKTPFPSGESGVACDDGRSESPAAVGAAGPALAGPGFAGLPSDASAGEGDSGGRRFRPGAAGDACSRIPGDVFTFGAPTGARSGDRSVPAPSAAGGGFADPVASAVPGPGKNMRSAASARPATVERWSAAAGGTFTSAGGRGVTSPRSGCEVASRADRTAAGGGSGVRAPALGDSRRAAVGSSGDDCETVTPAGPSSFGPVATAAPSAAGGGGGCGSPMNWPDAGGAATARERELSSPRPEDDEGPADATG